MVFSKTMSCLVLLLTFTSLLQGAVMQMQSRYPAMSSSVVQSSPMLSSSVIRPGAVASGVVAPAVVPAVAPAVPMYSPVGAMVPSMGVGVAPVAPVVPAFGVGVSQPLIPVGQSNFYRSKK